MCATLWGMSESDGILMSMIVTLTLARFFSSLFFSLYTHTYTYTYCYYYRETPPKWQENDDLVSGGHGPAWPSWELAWTIDWVNRLRTSADKRMWSGRRAVVMRTGRRAELLGVKLGCPSSRCRAVVSDVLCVRSYVLFVYVCVYMCMCVCVRT